MTIHDDEPFVLYAALKAMQPAQRKAHLATLNAETLKRLQALHDKLNPVSAMVRRIIKKGNQL